MQTYIKHDPGPQRVCRHIRIIYTSGDFWLQGSKCKHKDMSTGTVLYFTIYCFILLILEKLYFAQKFREVSKLALTTWANIFF